MSFGDFVSMVFTLALVIGVIMGSFALGYWAGSKPTPPQPEKEDV